MSKYHAKPVVVDNIRFHSTKEARRYQELRLLEKAGEIGGLLLQPSFELSVVDLSVGARLRIAASKLSTKDYPLQVTKIGTYRGDFSYWQPPVGEDGSKRVVEDVKGYDTPMSKWKRRHVAAQYGIEVLTT